MLYYDIDSDNDDDDSNYDGDDEKVTYGCDCLTFTFNSISSVSFFACAVESSVDILTGGIVIAIVHLFFALINVITLAVIS